MSFLFEDKRYDFVCIISLPQKCYYRLKCEACFSPTSMFKFVLFNCGFHGLVEECGILMLRVHLLLFNV